MSFDLSIVIPQNSWAQRESLVAELEQIFISLELSNDVDFPSKMPDEHIVYMLETVMFPFYPTVKEQYHAFCVQKNYQEEPLAPEIAKEFWLLMTARELASVNLNDKTNDALIKIMFAQLLAFVRKHQLGIFNTQSGELEDLESPGLYPKFWNEKE